MFTLLGWIWKTSEEEREREREQNKMISEEGMKKKIGLKNILE